MEEIPTRTGAHPARSQRDHWVLGSVAGGTVIAVAAFMAGRASVDSPDCAGAKRVAAESRSAFLAAAEKGTPEGRSVGREPLRHYSYLVLQNPHCFSASERDDAQAALDTLDRAS